MLPEEMNSATPDEGYFGWDEMDSGSAATQPWPPPGQRRRPAGNGTIFYFPWVDPNNNRRKPAAVDRPDPDADESALPNKEHYLTDTCFE